MSSISLNGRHLWFLGLFVAFYFFVGCGTGSRPNTAHLQGTVTIGGQPIPGDADASISFKVTERGQGRSSGSRIVEGKYDAVETPLGKVKAYISVQQQTGKMLREGIGSPYAEFRSLVPQQYEKGIDVEVTGDNASQDFDL